MADLYLQALMHGQVFKKNIGSALANQRPKNRFEIETEKQIESYLKTLPFDDEDSPQSQLLTSEMKRAAIREELREEAKMSELSGYLNTAFKILISNESGDLDTEQSELIKKEFENANKALDEIDICDFPTDNFQTLLKISDPTIDFIFKIALAKFNENKYLESLSLFILLAVLIPEDPDYWYRAGIMAHKCQNYEFATRLYAAATSVDSALLGPWMFSVDCYLKQNRQQEAEAAYAEALSISEAAEVEDCWKELFSEYLVIFKKS